MSKIIHELHAGHEHAILVITKDGIRTLTGDASYQVSAFFEASMFQRYVFDNSHRDQVTFRFILNDFTEILNLHKEEHDENTNGHELMAESKTSLYIQYKKLGDPLKLKLENRSNMTIHCELKAFNTSNNVVFSPLQFGQDDEIIVITLNSKKFYEYVLGLDLTTSKIVDLSLGRGESIKLTTCSELGESDLQIRLDNSDVIRGEIHAPSNCVYGNKYKTSYLKPALDALKNSCLMHLKCSPSGLLCLQHFHSFERGKDGNYTRPDKDIYITDGRNIVDKTSGLNRIPSIEYYILAQAIPSYDID